RPTMQKVPDDRNRQPGGLALALADRQEVEQRLGRMLMGAVTSVNHRAFDEAGQQMRRAGRGMADDDSGRPHGNEVTGGIEQGFTLSYTAGRSGDVDGVGR